MAIINVDSTNFEVEFLSEGIVLLDCWASWCKGCKDFEPVFEAAAARHPAHTFAKVDTQAERELTEKLGVSHIPTLILFRDGLLLLRQPGYVPADGLDEIIAKAESLDMDEVRAGMAEGQGSTSRDP
jgi:thioredoxin 1